MQAANVCLLRQRSFCVWSQTSKWGPPLGLDVLPHLSERIPLPDALITAACGNVYLLDLVGGELPKVYGSCPE